MAKKSVKSVSHLVDEAAKLDVSAFSMNMPLYVLLGEAIDVARFCERFWNSEREPRTRTVVRPGLELAGEDRLPRTIVAEIIELHELVQKSQTAYLLAIAPPTESTERAEFVLDEISAAIEWVCDDGVLDEKDAKLAAIVDAHRDDPESEDALASELADYVGLADELAADLAKVAAFDDGLVDEAKDLVRALRERSAARIRRRGGDASTLLTRRNQFAAMLIERMNRVRTAARYVFRRHDDIVKQATSAYQRRRRAAARRRASEAAALPASETLTELAPAE